MGSWRWNSVLLFHSNICALNLCSVTGNQLKNNLYNILVCTYFRMSYHIIIKSTPATKMGVRNE